MFLELVDRLRRHIAGIGDKHSHADLTNLTTGDPHTQYPTQAEYDVHSARHDSGGADALASDAAAATASLRTLGTGAAQAAAGNDSRLTDTRTPTAHATSHNSGGSDVLASDAAAATPSLRTLGTTSVKAAAGDHTTPAMSATVAGHVPTPPNNTTTFLRGDGTFAAPATAAGGTPALVLSTTNTAGVASTFIRTDDTILAFDATSPADVAYAPAVGAAATAARRDHAHDLTLTSSQTFLANDVTMVTDAVWYDAASVSFAAGTWLFIGTAEIYVAASASRNSIRIGDGTTTYAVVETYLPTATVAYSLAVSAVVVLAGTTTVKLQGASATTNNVIRAECAIDTAADKATSLIAIRIA